MASIGPSTGEVNVAGGRGAHLAGFIIDPRTMHSALMAEGMKLDASPQSVYTACCSCYVSLKISIYDLYNTLVIPAASQKRPLLIAIFVRDSWE